MLLAMRALGPERVAWVAGSCQLHSCAEGSAPGATTGILHLFHLLTKLPVPRSWHSTITWPVLSPVRLLTPENLRGPCLLLWASHTLTRVCAHTLHPAQGLVRAAVSAGRRLLLSPEPARNAVGTSCSLSLSWLKSCHQRLCALPPLPAQENS